MFSRIRFLAGPLAAVCILLASSSALAWTSFEYRNADGEYRYGIRDGSSKLFLGMKSRKAAGKVAGEMNRADDADEAGGQEGGRGGDGGDGGVEGGSK